MRTMIRILFALLLISINTYSQKNDSKSCFKYPKKIVKLHLKDNYDDARWVLFNWFGAQILDEVYYGQMELVYKRLVRRNDTIFIDFGFYESNVSQTNKKELKLVAKTSVAFKQNTRQCIWAFVYPFIAPSSGLEFGDKLLEGELSDETSQFLQEKRDIINKCFLELARKKKIID